MEERGTRYIRIDIKEKCMSLPNGENAKYRGNGTSDGSVPPAGKSYSQSTYRYYTGGISGVPVHKQSEAFSGAGSVKRRKIKWPVLISACVCLAALITGAVIVISTLVKNGSGGAPNGHPGIIGSTAVPVQTQIPGEDVSESVKRDFVKSYENRYAENVYIDGVDIGGLTRTEAERKLSTVNYDEDARADWKMELTYGDLHYEVQEEMYRTVVDYDARRQALDYAYSIGKCDEQTGKSLENAYNELVDNNTNGYSFHTPVTIVSVSLDEWLEEIADAVYVAPRNAYISEFNPQNYKSPFKVVDDVPGQRLNVEKVKQDILNYAASGKSGPYQIVPEVLRADISTEDAWKSVSLLSKWTTTISTTSSENRNNNIVLAMRNTNGKILNDGEVFSFNGLVDRKTVNGFLPAPAYVNGDIATQVGGGVCQASSTIYMAALLANLKIVERQPHSMAVSYTEFGKDATVNSEGRVIDLKFQNNTGGPVYICTGVGEKNKRTVYCYIYGPAMESGVSYDIETIEVETVIAAEQLEPVYKKDKERLYVTYTDEDPYLVKEAVDGHVVDAYLVKYKNGEEVERTRVSHDVFTAQPAVYYIGVEKPPVFPEDEGLIP